MSDPYRQQNIRRAILDKVERAEPYALPEESLQVEVSASVRPVPAQAEFDDAMLLLQSRGYIKSLPDELDENIVKWFITEAGKTLLRKL